MSKDSTMEIDHPASTALRGLRAANEQLHAPPEIGQALLRSFDAQGRMRRPSWRERLKTWTAPLVSAGAVAAAAMLVLLAPPPPAAQAAQTHPFIAIGAADRLAGRTDLTVVETRVSQLDLAAWGMPVAPSSVDGTVRTQLLVGADGEPLALRFMNE
jgi:hypothetical protein